MGQFLSWPTSAAEEICDNYHRQTTSPPPAVNCHRQSPFSSYSSSSTSYHYTPRQSPISRLITRNDTADFEAKFRDLCAHFDDFRLTYASRISGNDQIFDKENNIFTRRINTLSDDVKRAEKRVEVTEAELAECRQQMHSFGDLFDEFLDAMTVAQQRATHFEATIERRLALLEAKNGELKQQLVAVASKKETNTNDVNDEIVVLEDVAARVAERHEGDEQQHSVLPAAAVSDDGPLESSGLTFAEVEGGAPAEMDDQLAAFVAQQLPPADASGQLTLNKFKYSCQFVRLLYSGGARFDSVFCNIFSDYPPAFFEELIEHALGTRCPQAMVRRIFIWLAADEPWPDMRALFPCVRQCDVAEDRVRYEFDNEVLQAGQRVGFVLRIRAPARAELFRKMTNFSLCRK